MADTNDALLHQCRINLGPAPREVSRAERNYFNIGLSFFMRSLLFLTGDKLQVILRAQTILRDQGRVVWGALLQANQRLFDPANRRTLPANLLYSPDSYFDENLPTLQELASEINQLKDTMPGNAQLKQLVLALSNKTLRTMRLRIPGAMCQAKEVFFTTCLIHPPHLPSGYLAASFFPIVICPERTEAVMILPSHYWPEAMCKLWLNED